MNGVFQGLLGIFTAIITVAIIAVIVSKKSNTAGLVTSISDGLSKVLGAALGPVK